MRVRVDGHGATCHTGRLSCFYRTIPLGQRAEDGPVRLEDTGGAPLFDPKDVYGGSGGVAATRAERVRRCGMRVMVGFRRKTGSSKLSP